MKRHFPYYEDTKTELQQIVIELEEGSISVTLEPSVSDDFRSIIEDAATTLVSDERDGKGTTPEIAKKEVLFYKTTPAYKAVVDHIVKNLPDIDLKNQALPIQNLSQMTFNTIIFPPGLYQFKSLNVISIRVSEFGRATAEKVGAHSHEIAWGDVFVAKGSVDIDIREKCAFIVMTSKLGTP
ncbi:hypothetical protein EMCG_04555 [[Emmonsia] crescens]|uniref:Uncharacterized protein n=1 Tax=[Emmonsia] crescens TaxID=73230 RepID=A0A0G2J7C0_9EURO|nr:hypothetical protein EMCG_04555 [Emmonsia crescens UAMH 3008]